MAEVRDAVHDVSTSALKRYQGVVVGKPGLGSLAGFELGHLMSQNVPGALGLVLRKKLLARLFGRCGSSPVLGQGLTLRCPGKIHVGDRFSIDAHGVLDGRTEEDVGIRCGDGVLCGHNATLSAKGGRIVLRDRVQVGVHCTILSAPGCTVDIGEDIAIGPYSFIGGTRYNHGDLERPIADQGHDRRGGVTIGAGTLVYARATIIDGVTIGKGAVIAAGAVVNKDVPDFAIAAGVPAKIVGSRKDAS
ncbi:MAG: acetyltransferase [Phycisphaeraceae bacterium]|nr:MAG: acetyltransferase [Phycisphaeraceae bacterium]